jgi:hypothetical protein
MTLTPPKLPSPFSSSSISTLATDTGLGADTLHTDQGLGLPHIRTVRGCRWL